MDTCLQISAKFNELCCCVEEQSEPMSNLVLELRAQIEEVVMLLQRAQEINKTAQSIIPLLQQMFEHMVEFMGKLTKSM